MTNELIHATCWKCNHLRANGKYILWCNIVPIIVENHTIIGYDHVIFSNNELNENFKTPQDCPYILEHAFLREVKK